MSALLLALITYCNTNPNYCAVTGNTLTVCGYGTLPIAIHRNGMTIRTTTRCARA